MLTTIAVPLPELPDMRPPAGEPWDSMLSALARPVAQLERTDVPIEPGVYLWRWHGRLAYVGTASSLRTRIWGRHLGGGVSLGSSSLRRDVAEFLLGIPTTETIKGRRKLTVDERDVVRTWLQSCDIAWRIMPTPEDAAAFEDELRLVWRPLLNRVRRCRCPRTVVRDVNSAWGISASSRSLTRRGSTRKRSQAHSVGSGTE